MHDDIKEIIKLKHGKEKIIISLLLRFVISILLEMYGN